MGIVDILEEKTKYKGLFKHILGPKRIELRLSALCSCENEYKIKENLDFRDHSVKRVYTCNNCKEKDCLMYNVAVKDHSNGYDGYWVANVNISHPIGLITAMKWGNKTGSSQP